MKVMVLGKATARSEAGELGNAEDFAAMGLYMEKLVKPVSCWPVRGSSRPARASGSPSTPMATPR